MQLEATLTKRGKRGDVSLIIDEKAIEYCGTLCEPALAAVSNACRSVVACRARKDQKAQLLTMIRRSAPTSCWRVGPDSNTLEQHTFEQIRLEPLLSSFAATLLM